MGSIEWNWSVDGCLYSSCAFLHFLPFFFYFFFFVFLYLFLSSPFLSFFSSSFKLSFFSSLPSSRLFHLLLFRSSLRSPISAHFAKLPHKYHKSIHQYNFQLYRISTQPVHDLFSSLTVKSDPIHKRAVQ